MYSISATRVITDEDGTSVMRQIPTFYLDERTQGILTEAGAVEIARDILDLPERDWSPHIRSVTWHITAVYLGKAQ